jgi:DsbC/DsbD-like thiol-disulfide interchange protein
MCHFKPMKHMILRLLLCFIPLFAALTQVRAEIRAGAWLTLPDIRLRLLIAQEGGSNVQGGVEMQLAPGFKTYWKNPGDSGVPPRFDFSASRGVSGVEVRYPLPRLLDDKAGGSLIGYENHIIFPFEAMRDAQTPLAVQLKLDFAICGTMCIPLSVEMAADGANMQAEAGADALKTAFAHAPKPEAGDVQPADIRLYRLSSGTKPRWQVTVPFKGAAADMRAFPEGKEFLTVTAITPAEPGMVSVVLEGEALSGTEARFNPARLTFGVEGHARDIPLDLDGAVMLP